MMIEYFFVENQHFTIPGDPSSLVSTPWAKVALW